MHLHATAARRKPSEIAQRAQNDAGYTLIEILVVLGILAMLVGVAAPQVLRYLGTARTETAKTQINNLLAATELYYLDNNSYPPSDIGLKALLEPPPQAKRWNGPYLKKGAANLLDPWGKPYIYLHPGKHSAVDISTLGKDGKTGGNGEDADITSW